MHITQVEEFYSWAERAGKPRHLLPLFLQDLPHSFPCFIQAAIEPPKPKPPAYIPQHHAKVVEEMSNREILEYVFMKIYEQEENDL
jgi:hypothetical protein